MIKRHKLRKEQPRGTAYMLVLPRWRIGDDRARGGPRTVNLEHLGPLGNNVCGCGCRTPLAGRIAVTLCQACGLAFCDEDYWSTVATKRERRTFERGSNRAVERLTVMCWGCRS